MQAPTQRITRDYRQIINATPDTVFPLLCPVRETEWLAGWQSRIIYSDSGVAEPDCVFSTREENAEAIWVISQHDPKRHRLQLVKTLPELTITCLQIQITPKQEGQQSQVDIRYRITALSKRGEQLLQQQTEALFNARMQHWEASMNHYPATGQQHPSVT